MPNPAKDFIKAAKRGDLMGLKSLLDSDTSLIETRDTDGSTAVHCATWKGHEAAVEWLLSVGADVHAHNENDHWGTTALHAAAHANQARIARRLINAGADVNAQDREGRTPLFHTTFHKAKATAKVLLEHGAS
ncbi:MAG TPA: ankyrin repeat domain-containing protein [Pyrinomonadaceae bacterium]